MFANSYLGPRYILTMAIVVLRLVWLTMKKFGTKSLIQRVITRYSKAKQAPPKTPILHENYMMQTLSATTEWGASSKFSNHLLQLFAAPFCISGTQTPEDENGLTPASCSCKSRNNETKASTSAMVASRPTQQLCFAPKMTNSCPTQIHHDTARQELPPKKVLR
eukprot:2810233-Amphidinium_carterae.1